MIKLSQNDVVLFIGDSITDGNRGLTMDLNHIMGHGYQQIVASRLAADNHKAMPKFINKGISGNKSFQILKRWQEDCLQYKPTIISLLCGVNDVLYNIDKTETSKEAVEYIEEILKTTFSALPDVKFILCEPFYLDVRNQDAPYENIPHPKCEEDFHFGNNPLDIEKVEKAKKKIKMLQADLPLLAEKYGCIYVPFQDVYDKAVETTPASYFIWDNVHPTMVGHRLMADRWLEVVEKALA
jgi:lysophospholipase L1-like esterase